MIYGMEITFSQTDIPFYEQIAFEFFQNDILTKNPIDKKMSVYNELKPIINLDMLTLSLSHYNGLFNNPFWYPKCNKFFNDAFKLVSKEKNWNNIKNNLSGKKILDFSKLNKIDFKIKKYGKGKYPRLYIDQSVTVIVSEIELTIVNVNLIERYSGIIYHIQIDKNGKVTYWCQTGYIE